MTLHGVDVSAHQAAWKPAPSDSFVFIKAAEGHTYVSAALPGQVAAARAAGLVVGFYHFLWPGDPQLQAQWFERSVRPHLVPGKDLLVCDWEATKGGTASEADKDAFLAEVRKLLPGHKIGVYVNRSMWNASGKRAGDFLWLAEYASKPTVTGWTFWQYADHSPAANIDQNSANFSTATELRDWINPPEVPVSDERIPFRGAGITCKCVIDSLPWVELDMLRLGIIKSNIDIFQLGYRDDVTSSAGTHARGFNTDTGQYSPAAIDVWRLWGWNMQHRTTAQGFALEHGHGGPWGCPHGSPAAQDQIAQWRNRQNGLVSHGPVEGRWPIKNYRDAMGERKKIIMAFADDVAAKTAAKVAAGNPSPQDVAKAIVTQLFADNQIGAGSDEPDPKKNLFWRLPTFITGDYDRLVEIRDQQKANGELLTQILTELQKPPTPPPA